MSTISADGANDTIQIIDIDNYTINNGSLIAIANWPVTINNTNLVPAENPLKVLFPPELSLTDTNHYFICGSDGIQFGSTSLNQDGKRPIIIVNVTGYPGLIQNGTPIDIGKNNIFVCNLVVDGLDNYLLDEAGWIGQSCYSNGVSNNYIINCSSSGNGSIYCGGIVGSSACNTGGLLQIKYCDSSSSISTQSGGIVGPYTCFNDTNNTGNVIATYCSCSSSIIESTSGGIFGYGCKRAIAGYCYTTGIINISGGGIFGSSSGSCDAINCYSTGEILNGNEGSGGIFGLNSIGCSAINCYSTGEIGDASGGIFAAGYASTTYAINCYTSGASSINSGGIYAGSNNDNLYGNNNYSEANVGSSGWKDVNARLVIGGPSGADPRSTFWVTTEINTPYLINNIGFSPYSLDNIILSEPFLNISFTQTVEFGGTTISAVLSSDYPNPYEYSIVSVKNQYPDIYPGISINPNTGAITMNVPEGVYKVVVKNSTNPYSITIFIVTVNAAPPPPPTPTPVLAKQPPCCGANLKTSNPQVTRYEASEDKSRVEDQTLRNFYDTRINAVRLGQAVSPQPLFKSYTDLMKYKQGALQYRR